MKWFFLASIFAVLGMKTVTGQVDDNVETIFAEADKLYNLVNNISYTYQYMEGMQYEPYTSDDSGNVYLRKVEKDTLGYYYHIESFSPERSIIYNGNAYADINHSTKHAKLYKSNLAAQLGLPESNSYLISPILVTDHFKKLLVDPSVKSIELAKDSMILGDLCYNIKIEYIPVSRFENKQEYYFIQKNNFFCKAILAVTQYAGKPGFNMFTILEAEINNPLDKDLFKVSRHLSSEYKVEKVINQPVEHPALLEKGETMPKFKGYTIAGDKITHKDLRGKVALIDFWSIHCPYCVESVPILDSLAITYKNIQFLGINILDSEDAIKEFQDFGKTYYPTILGDDNIAEKFAVSFYPVHYIIDQEGKIAYATNGYHDGLYDELSSAIESLIGSGSR